MLNSGKGFTFLAGVVLSALIYGAFGMFTKAGSATTSAVAAAPGETGVEESKQKGAAPVVTQSVKQMLFQDKIEISGDVQAKNFALVSARVAGVIDDFFVDEGDRVEAGKTKLFQIDKIVLNKSAEIARQDVDVAQSALAASQATSRRVAADLDKARIDYERYQRLYEKDQAVTKNALEEQESRFKQTQAAMEEAKAAEALSASKKMQALSNLSIAEKDLDDSLIVAPISGVVSRRMREPGEMAERGAAVLRIDDLSTVEFVAFLPEVSYSRVVPTSTTIHVSVAGSDLGALPVSYKSPVIESKLRNFEVKAILKNPPKNVAPGAMSKMSVILESHNALGVPRSSILERSGQKVVFVVSSGKARMVAVETGLEMDGWVEVKNDAVHGGDDIVVMGQDQLNDGDAVSAVEAEVGQ